MSRFDASATGCASAALLFGILLTGCGGSGDGPDIRPPPVQPPPPPPTGAISVNPLFTGLPSFTQPLAMLQAPGDASRWFVVEKPGTVRVFDNDPGVTASEVWLDLTGSISAAGEGGLLGLAFDPDFDSNGFVYASYTAPGTPLVSVVSRFAVDAGTGLPDPASEERILELPQPETNHNGGHLAFGGDGFLYIGLGDGGGAGDPFDNGQDTTTLPGSILRIDVSSLPYRIPADNPFGMNTDCVGGSGASACPEIWVWGLRNPWRFSFDAQTGLAWIGDVGQNQREEVNRASGGENFGWNEREGTLCFEPPSGCDLMNVEPVAEIVHPTGQSVTGGYVYRGSAFPSLEGQYLFGDFVSGRIWRVPADASQGATPVELADTALSISSFGEDADGELYVVDFAGRLYQITVPP